MVAELQRRVSEAVLAGASLEAIERTIIGCASLDEEERAALWLYAAALRDQPSLCAASRAEPPLIRA